MGQNQGHRLYMFLVGVYVLLFPVLSLLCKKYCCKYSLLFSVSIRTIGLLKNDNSS